jgi:hypothetical protein
VLQRCWEGNLAEVDLLTSKNACRRRDFYSRQGDPIDAVPPNWTSLQLLFATSSSRAPGAESHRYW